MAAFKSIGKLERFKGAEECFYSDNGYIYTDILGGPKAANYLKNFEARKDDILILSFPKTGTTWIQEIAYLIGTNLDFETAKKVHANSRVHYMERYREENPTDFSKIPSPRFLKTHYPYSLLPTSVKESNCKIICPLRNPKDTIVSYYFFSKANVLMDYSGDLASYVDDFVNDKVIYAPYWKYILECWEKRHQDNIMIVMFEEMKKDLASNVRDVAEFLGKSLSDEDVEKIVKHCSFDSMKDNPAITKVNSTVIRHHISPYMRKGEVGDWKNHFTEDMNEKVDRYIEKYFSDTDLKFTYE